MVGVIGQTGDWQQIGRVVVPVTANVHHGDK